MFNRTSAPFRSGYVDPAYRNRRFSIVAVTFQAASKQLLLSPNRCKPVLQVVVVDVCIRWARFCAWLGPDHHDPKDRLPMLRFCSLCQFKYLRGLIVGLAVAFIALWSNGGVPWRAGIKFRFRHRGVVVFATTTIPRHPDWATLGTPLSYYPCSRPSHAGCWDTHWHW